MRRPIGILPGGNVFQLPPPAFEARATLAVSAGAGWAGRTGTGVVVGTGAAWAAGGLPATGAVPAGGGETAGLLAAFGGSARIAAIVNGVPVGAAGFGATIAGAGVAAGA